MSMVPELMKNVPRRPCWASILAAVASEIRPSSKVRVTTPGACASDGLTGGTVGTAVHRGGDAFEEAGSDVGTNEIPHPLTAMHNVASNALSRNILEPFGNGVDDLVQAGVRRKVQYLLSFGVVRHPAAHVLVALAVGHAVGHELDGALAAGQLNDACGQVMDRDLMSPT